ncbi:bifunctional 3-demethylubiquinone-9 3-methyltransferase/ 2-octaprenyl-6-hydroxy phenol methylase [Actinokineospora sp. UTMC 2448]|nr:bifunctional 3-demethylubiquinone-9 3-methyltransferase/ 2-octaprenyl-6-hydroxy phenol methylase [Actinokineospora sp. UTMC 2448]
MRDTRPVLLTLTTTRAPATDLGYLLFKHPDKAQRFDTAAGPAFVFYPRADEQECTAALLLEVDPVALSRAHRGQDTGLGHYVNDGPYAAGSLLAVALSRVFKTAMNGRCEARPELAASPIPLRVHVPSAPCKGTDLPERLFGPLGWQVDAGTIPLDPAFPEWGDAPYVDLRLTGEIRLADALRQLYVLLPVLDDAKHYWVGADEVDKLLRAGGDWLAAHPERDLISARYLKHRGAYVRTALERLTELDGGEVREEPAENRPLAAVRRETVLGVLRELGARRVLDLGCGGGALLRELVAEPTVTEIVGTDVSPRALAGVARWLERLPERTRERIAVRQSSLTYGDPSLAGFDAAVLMEVVEHVDPPRLPALERAVFDVARPAHVLVTTPNIEHNVRFPGLTGLRHPDHRFEWTRAQFRAWAEAVADHRGYTVAFRPVGPDDPEVGPPTQLAVFSRKEA